MSPTKSRESYFLSRSWGLKTTILFGVFISALCPFIPAQGSSGASNMKTATKSCFDIQYEIKRHDAESKGFNSSPLDIEARNRKIDSSCSSLIKSWGKIQRDFETSWELVKLIAESPGGLSGFILDPEQLSPAIASGINESKVNAMDDFISPVYNVKASCKNGRLIGSWQRVWGTQTPTGHFTQNISKFCNRLDMDYGQIVEAASRNLRKAMEDRHRLALKDLVKLKSECDEMAIYGNVSKQRASQIRNSEVSNVVSYFRYVYDPYMPDEGGRLVMNNNLQASLIGMAVLADSLSSLNNAADKARISCANVLINY